MDGLKDAGTPLSHSELLQSLVKRRQAWLRLKKKRPLIRRTQPNCHGYELVGGAFAHTSWSDDHLEIVWLPTASNAEGRTLSRPSIGISGPREFTMDPTQDLIALVEEGGYSPTTNTRILRVHIRSISTNAIHPQAQQSPLKFTVIPRPGYPGNTASTAFLQIAHNILAVYFHYAPDRRVLIWDWTTSDLILVSSILCYFQSILLKLHRIP